MLWRIKSKYEKKTDANLTLAANIFWNCGIHNPSITLVSIDLEWNEKQEITEVGIAWISSLAVFNSCDLHPQCRHLVVREQSSQYFEDRSHLFRYGKSEKVLPVLIDELLGDQFKQFATDGEVTLIGHTINVDLSILATAGINLPPMAVCDIALAFQALSKGSHVIKLADILRYYCIPFTDLHNAGNDAYLTLVAFISLMTEAAGETN